MEKKIIKEVAEGGIYESNYRTFLTCLLTFLTLTTRRVVDCLACGSITPMPFEGISRDDRSGSLCSLAYAQREFPSTITYLSAPYPLYIPRVRLIYVIYAILHRIYEYDLRVEFK